MTSKRKPSLISPIPAVVEVAGNDVHLSLLKRFGTASPSKSKNSGPSKVVSPLAVFQGDGRSFRAQASSNRSYGGDGDSTTGTLAQRLGIRRPTYYSRDDDESSHDHGTNGDSSHRIGITRPSYEPVEGGAPISPLNLFLEKKAASPAPNLIELDHSDDSSDPFVAWNHGRISRTSSRESTSTEDVMKDDDSIDRMIHEATAEGHYLVSSKQLSAAKDEIKYDLSKKKGGLNKAMRHASERHVTRPPRPSASDHHAGAPNASFKIFLLLLNPKAKIFELIQVIYAPSVTTIGDVLAMIPGNASEPALGSLSYIGLCRPKDGIEITEMQLMASGSHCKMSCARIVLGEILVAIPAGYSGEQCAKLAVPILKNQRIQSLLKRSDPLGMKRKSSRPHRHSRSGRRRSGSSHSSSSRVETVKEDPEGEDSPQVKQAMRHAMEAAAMANADLPTDHDVPLERSNSVDDSIHQLENWRSSMDFANDNASLNDSIASSVVSTASSYKSGLASTMTFQSTSRRLPRLSRSTSRRKHRREQRKYYVGRVAAVSLVAMVSLYNADSSAPTARQDMHDILGWTGLMQFCCLFVALLKMQKYVQGGHAAEKNCPFVRATVAAVESFREHFTSK